MNRTKNHVRHYNKVSEDIKFVSNSLIRLRVLKALYDNPSNMKELTHTTDLSYSSISSTLHKLELRDMVYRNSNRYYLASSLKLQMKNILQLSIIINLLDEIFNIIDGHIVHKLPMESILELHLLDGSLMLESDGVNADMIDNLIENNIGEAKSARCILPVYSEGINAKLNELADDGKFVEIKVSEKLSNIYNSRSRVKYISTFRGKNNFLLIITDKMMILGFFRNDGIFDKNRLVISTGKDSLKWANNLFRYFKKLNK